MEKKCPTCQKISKRTFYRIADSNEVVHECGDCHFAGTICATPGCNTKGGKQFLKSTKYQGKHVCRPCSDKEKNATFQCARCKRNVNSKPYNSKLQPAGKVCLTCVRKERQSRKETRKRT